MEPDVGAHKITYQMMMATAQGSDHQLKEETSCGTSSGRLCLPSHTVGLVLPLPWTSWHQFSPHQGASLLEALTLVHLFFALLPPSPQRIRSDSPGKMLGFPLRRCARLTTEICLAIPRHELVGQKDRLQLYLRDCSAWISGLNRANTMRFQGLVGHRESHLSLAQLCRIIRTTL